MLRSQDGPCVLSSADGLPVLHGPEPFGLVKAERGGIRGRIDVVVYHAGSRSQLQIMLHFLVPSLSSRREGRGLKLGMIPNDSQEHCRNIVLMRLAGSTIRRMPDV